jgi:hypothetical protein
MSYALQVITEQRAWSLGDRFEDAVSNMVAYLLFVGFMQGALTLAVMALSTPFAFWRGWTAYRRLQAKVLLLSVCVYLWGCIGDGLFVAMFHHNLYSNNDSIGDFIPWLPSVRWIVKPGLGGKLSDEVTPIVMIAAWTAVALPVWIAAILSFLKIGRIFNGSNRLRNTEA